MRRAFPDAIIEPDEDLIEAMDNDAKDRHVAATAVGCGADAIVTLNVKDFRGAACRRPASRS